MKIVQTLKGEKMSEKQLSFDGAMKIVGEEKWILIKDIERLEKFIQNQQATISKQLDQIIELQDKYRTLEFNHNRLEKRNKAQYEKIGEQQSTINLLLNLLYQSEATVINEYSSDIGEDMAELDKLFKEKDIKEIERFVRGCDDE